MMLRCRSSYRSLLSCLVEVERQVLAVVVGRLRQTGSVVKTRFPPEEHQNFAESAELGGALIQAGSSPSAAFASIGGFNSALTPTFSSCTAAHCPALSSNSGRQLCWGWGGSADLGHLQLPVELNTPSYPHICRWTGSPSRWRVAPAADPSTGPGAGP